MIEASNWDASRQFQELTARAQRQPAVTFYTIEAAGLRSYRSGAADRGAKQSFTAIDRVRRLNYQSPLQSMAAETGGLAIIGTSNFRGGLERVSHDLDGYYSLGYVASHGGDGRYHDIEVKVKRDGLKVRSRQGYRAKTPAVWMAEKTSAQLRFDLDANPLEVDFDVGGGVPAEGSQYFVPVTVKVPIKNIVLLPQSDLHFGKLKLFVAATDDRGRIASVGDQPWPIEIPASRLDEAMAMSFSFEVKLQMRPGSHRIAVGVRDELGAVSSFARRDVRIGRGRL